MTFSFSNYAGIEPQHSPLHHLIGNALGGYKEGIGLKYLPREKEADIFSKEISPLAALASSPNFTGFNPLIQKMIAHRIGGYLGGDQRGEGQENQGETAGYASDEDIYNRLSSGAHQTFGPGKRADVGRAKLLNLGEQFGLPKEIVNSLGGTEASQYKAAYEQAIEEGVQRLKLKGYSDASARQLIQRIPGENDQTYKKRIRSLFIPQGDNKKAENKKNNAAFKEAPPGSVGLYKNGNLYGTAFSYRSMTVPYAIGDIIGFQALALTNGVFSRICDYPQTECRTEPQQSYTVVGQLPQKMIAYFDAGCISDVYVCEVPANGFEVNGCGDRRANSRCDSVPETVTVTIQVNGQGTISLNEHSTTSSKTITLPKGTSATIQGVPASGYKFIKFTQTNPPGETTQNPFSGTIVNSGTITAVFEVDIPTSGFTITADKTSGDTEYIANITITKSDDPNGTVKLFKKGLITECIPGLESIQLVNGTATVQLLVNSSGAIFAGSGLACTCALPELCEKSNILNLTVGTDWQKLIVPVGIGIAGVYLLGSLLKRS